jgi:hypothetical protein
MATQTGQLTLNEISIIEVDSDPSLSGGLAGAIGSIALLDDKTDGKMWIKSGSGATAWSVIPRYANGIAFTQGSVPFVDANGFFTQNNANFFWDNTNTRLAIPRLLISAGQTSYASASGEESRAQLHGTDTTGSQFSIMRYSADNLPPNLRFTKSRNASLGAHTAVAVNDIMGTVSFRGSDGSLFGLGATISGYVDATVAANSVPSRIQFSTTTLAGTTVQERMRIDSSGCVVIGGATAQDITGIGAFPLFQILGLGGVQMVQIQYSNDTIAPVFNSIKSRGVTIGTQGLLAADDELGRFQFRGSDGVNFQAGASIRALVDGTPAAGSMPGRLIFMTTPTGSTTPVERARIDAAGEFRAVNNIRIGASITDTVGNIRYTGTDFEGYTAGVWYSLTNGLRRKYTYATTGTQTTTSNVYAAVTELTTVSLPVGKYTFRVTGLFQSTAAGTGFGVRLGQGTATLGTIGANWFIAQAADGTAKFFGYDQTLVTDNVTSASVQTANTNAVFTGQGAFTVTSAGTVTVQIRSETNGTGVSIRAGSMLTIEGVL